MKKLFLMLLVVGAVTVDVRALTDKEVDIIVRAIFLAEGGNKAKVPYGILSIKVRDKAHAKRICENTVRNNWRRWIAGGKQDKFLDFLGGRYCPASVDPVGNRNWVRNVRAISKLPY